MKFFGAEKKRKRMKKAIMRDILDDNLRMIGKKPDYLRPNPWKVNPFRISIVILLSALFYFFAGHYEFFERTFMSRLDPDKTTTNPDYLNASDGRIYSFYRFNDKTPGIESTTPSNPHYSTFLNLDHITLSQLFGLKIRKIVIDPGHGGEDTGTKGKMGTREKDITLDIARRLKTRLEQYQDYQLLLTRNSDRRVSLDERVIFTNRNGADLFISIHVNYIPRKNLTLIETYFFGAHTDQEAMALAIRENQGTGYSLNEFNKIIKNIGNTLKTQESKSLAHFIQKSLFNNISKQNRAIKDWGIKTAPFVVLLGVNAPSVLAEVACLSDIEEERKLNKPYYREMISRYLEEGIVRYLNNNLNINLKNESKQNQNKEM